MKAKLLLCAVLIAVVLSAVYALVKPQSSADGTAPATASPAAADWRVTTLSAPAAQPIAQVDVLYARPNVFDIVVQRGRRVSEPAVLQVHQGEDVTLRITSDAADEFHLHGYNLHVGLSPERTATLRFTAKLTGRFTYELHRSELELGAVEVSPQ